MSLNNKESNGIRKLRSKPKKTHRVTSASLERILYKPFKVLDSGFFKYSSKAFRETESSIRIFL